MKYLLNAIILGVLLIICMASQGCQTPGGRSPGNVVDDSTVTTKIKAKLAADDILSIFTISVTTYKGEVTLAGTVKTSEQRQRASKIAQSVTGVNRVNNNIRLK